jgi:hypothetical protein
MLKDILEIALNTAADVAQSYVAEKFPDKSTPTEKRRLLIVMVVGIIVGIAVIVVVVRAS